MSTNDGVLAPGGERLFTEARGVVLLDLLDVPEPAARVFQAQLAHYVREHGRRLDYHLDMSDAGVLRVKWRWHGLGL